MPEINLILQKERNRRALILNIFGAILFLITFFFSVFGMLVYGISLYIAVPLGLASSVFGLVLATTFLVSRFFGFYLSLRPVEKDPFNPINKAIDLKEDTRIAVMMPIYHEDVRRVAGAFFAMIEELSHYKEAKHFEWFILSDSRKEDVIVQEQKAVFLLKEKFPDVGIHYRHRIMNTFAKVGNMSDFFRRWGSAFKAVIVLDGDSLMPPETMVTLAKTMEGGDNIGLIQCTNAEINSDSFFGRLAGYTVFLDQLIKPFAFYYFRMAQGMFRGHNAILRSEAILQYCNLPLLSKYGPFVAGKPKSHDFIEATLLEGMGYEVWELPTLIAFDDVIHNWIDFIKRETRWMHGALEWLCFFRLKKLSSFGKMRLFFYAIAYFATVVGLIFFITSYFGLYYVFQHPLETSITMHRYQNIMMWSTLLFVFSLSTSIALPLIILWKKYKYRISIVKTIFSVLLGLLYSAMTSPILMLLLDRSLWYWWKGESIVWGSQNRTSRVLSWEESFKFTWFISIFGLVCCYFFYFYIMSNMTPTALRVLGIQFGTTFIFIFILFLAVPLVAMVFSPVIVRVTSRSFPLMDKMGWFKQPWEGKNEYPVVRETRNRTTWFEDQVSETYSFEQALSDPYFALRHLAQCPSRPQKYAFWKDKLAMRNIQDLTRLEKLVVFRCRELWEMFMTKNFHVSKEKTQ